MKIFNTHSHTANHQPLTAHFGRAAALFVVTLLLVAACHADNVNIFGFDHTSLGNAKLAVDNGGLVVSNIGVGGGDGVLVNLPSTTTLWAAHINDVGQQSDGSFFQMTGIGTINGQQNQVVSTARVTSFDNGQQVDIGVNSSSVTSHPVLAQYFLHGVLVGSELVNPETDWYGGRNNLSWHVDCQVPCIGPDHWPISEEIDWLGQDVYLKTPNLGQLLVDDMVLETTSTDIVFSGYSGASWTASGISTFTINAEDYQGTPEPSSLALLGTGVVGLGGLLRRRLLN